MRPPAFQGVRPEPDWHRITGHDGETVYWNRPIDDGLRLAVSRIHDPETGHGIPSRWRWTVYRRDPGRRVGQAWTKAQGGTCTRPADGRRKAEAAAGVARGRIR